MSAAPSNALAGPSSPRTSLPDLFLPPQGPLPPRQHLASTQDLLSRFHLLPSYDKYVRPFATQYSDDGHIRSTPAPDKGKGKQVDTGMAPSQARTPGGPGAAGVDGPDGDDDDAVVGRGERKKKNTYKALIKGIPGKHSMKKDDYLAGMMMAPPKQRTRIHQFDARTQQEAFTVSLEGLKYWNVNALILESAQAREDRKKRKELKRLAKAQQAQAAAAAAMQIGGTGTSPVVAQPQPIRAGASGGGIPHRGSSATPQAQQPSAATPKSVGTPRPISNVPRPGSTVPRPGSTAPRPGSAVPRPTSTAPSTGIKQEPKPPILPLQVPPTMAATPSRTATTTPTSVDSSRGKKREREHVLPSNGVPPDSHSHTGMNGVANGTTNGVPKIHAKAGVMGVHPRPVKKQRMDVQGQARDVSAPVQQPTPQGV